MKRRGIVLLAAAGAILLAALSITSCTKSSVPEKVEKLRIGVYTDSICALIYIAQQQGFFKRNGLDVSIANYGAGIYAVNDLLADKVDVATAAELVMALQVFKNRELRALGTTGSTHTVEVVARRDRGIEKPGDLRGKRFGITKNTISEFFLANFLSFNSIRPTEIRMVDLKPPEMLSAFSEGKIDAASCFPPASEAIKKKLAHKAIFWPAQGGRDFYSVLIARDDLVKTRPGAIDGLLKGMLDAVTFLKKSEREAQDIVQGILGVDHEALMVTWSKTRFFVRLDSDLLTLMEDEGRWAIKNKLVDAVAIPDYSTFLYLEGLKKIKPEAVGVSY